MARDTILAHESAPSLSVWGLVVDPGFGRAVDDSVALTLLVDDANDAPVINDQSVSITDAYAIDDLAGKVIASDPNGDNLSYAILSGDGFRIDADTGQLFVDATLAIDTYILQIEVSDGQASNTATVSIAVLDGNQAPIAIDQAFAIPQTAYEVGQFQATDPNGDTLSYAIDDPAFAIDADDLITVANSALLLYGRSHSPTVTITDPDGAVTTASVTIDIHFVLDIGVGWNFVSLPIDPIASTIDEVFADAPIIGRILVLTESGFLPATDAVSETAYWLYATQAVSISVPGTLADNQIAVAVGWNGIGAATEVQSPLRFTQVDTVYRWDVTHQLYRAVATTDQLTPGQGYLAHTTEAATLDLTAPIARSAISLDPLYLNLDFDETLSSFQ